MAKKIIGITFLIIASFCTIFFIYRLVINPNSILIFKTLISGELGLKWTLGVVLFHSFFYFIIFLLYAYPFVSPRKSHLLDTAATINLSKILSKYLRLNLKQYSFR